ncbi:hypothetical protein HMPREF1624_08327 [Sporothrix schenckii ATCC 58251]|uniref:RBR-type E3 ubiquitin transferase n=1 Tax=Sporothrix schenckii (strain ATCC 58251 / de Perez 2211183) TaxID=1391915 RepID=U7PL63_SPOS1|nr:hypothetical protein HMPREF1624_08327 [Sporothrix schenckii ATCC 58251]
MESDDDFLSNMSSEDDAMHDDSDNGLLSGGEDFDDFEEEPDDIDIDIVKDVAADDKRKHAYEVDFKVYEPRDLDRQQEELMDEVNMILEMRPEDAAILLRHFRWNRERLIEEYMESPSNVLEAAGLGADVVGLPRLEVIPGFTCDICCEDGEGLETFALKCGHRYCVDCYRQYLTQKIREEGEAARIQCPTTDCGRIIDAKSLSILVTPDLSDRYHELLNRTVSLERYLHYYNRYANHEQSAKLDKDIYTRTEQKMVQLQTSSGMSWIEVQYLNAASQALQTCRQTLKWTYAFAFYLARNNITEMFEDNQKDLEMAVEALSEMFEKPVSDLSEAKMKVDIMDKTAYCNKRRVILLEYTADNLAHGRWTFNNDHNLASVVTAKPAANARP